MRKFVMVALVALCACDALQEQGKKDIDKKVSDDVIKMYEISKRNGDKIEICVHAGFVAASFLQAHNEREFKTWKAIERQDCRAAGMPK